MNAEKSNVLTNKTFVSHLSCNAKNKIILHNLFIYCNTRHTIFEKIAIFIKAKKL